MGHLVGNALTALAMGMPMALTSLCAVVVPCRTLALCSSSMAQNLFYCFGPRAVLCWSLLYRLWSSWTGIPNATNRTSTKPPRGPREKKKKTLGWGCLDEIDGVPLGCRNMVGRVSPMCGRSTSRVEPDTGGSGVSLDDDGSLCLMSCALSGRICVFSLVGFLPNHALGLALGYRQDRRIVCRPL